MIVFKRYGHTFKIRNDDWKNLRERFNPENVVSQPGECFPDHWKIDIPCSFCCRYHHLGCERCPIQKFGGCNKFFDKLFRKTKLKIGTSFVRWEKSVDKKARRQLKRLNKIMDKIEEENNDRTRNSKNA